jgi:cysteine desulfurase
MGGFAGVGGMMLRNNGRKLSASWLGGGQERGLRPGTESALLISAFGEAAKHVEESRRLYKELIHLRDHLEYRLQKETDAKVLGQGLPRLPNTSAIIFNGSDPDALRIAIDLAGLSVGFGAACSGLAPEGSFALKRLGLSMEEERRCVRFSLPSTISPLEIDEAINRLVRLFSRSPLHSDRTAA